MTTDRAFASFTEIATLRIELDDSSPPIWRLVEVPTSITLKVLHDIVQQVMGWFDYHLWEITVAGRTYGPAKTGNGGGEGRRAASGTRLRDVLGPGTTRIDYVYDFGDDWRLTLTVSDVRSGDPGAGYPRLTGGERNGPPEDCGGIPGFYEMLDARQDPAHPDHAQVSEWLGGYDPDELDIFPIEVALRRIAARRNAAARRIVPPGEG